jgi:L-2,4-diaminobutyric acid acetyltransferase
MNKPFIKTRIPGIEDARHIHSLIKRCEPLDLNSCYAYMLVSTHFQKSSVVALHEERIIGFISAYFLPQKPDTLFVWQVAVDPQYRKKGLASIMLGDILNRPYSTPIDYVETTISPSNDASLALFKKLAAASGAEIRHELFAGIEDFGGEAHEEEILYRVGPLNSNK